MASDEPLRAYLTRKEAADYVSKRWFPCSVPWLCKLNTIGGGPTVRGAPTPGSRKFYLRDDLDEWAQARLAPVG